MVTQSYCVLEGTVKTQQLGSLLLDPKPDFLASGRIDLDHVVFPLI